MISDRTQNPTDSFDTVPIDERIRLGTGCFSAIVGSAVLFGWAYDIRTLTQIVPGLTAMNPITAVSLVVAGIALVIHPRATLHSVWVMGALIMLVGVAKLLQLAGGYDIEIDQLLFSAKLDHGSGSSPNRMAPNTAATLIMTGLALAASKIPSTRAALLSQGLSSIVIATTLFALIGYALGIVALYGLKAYIPMALHTACALMVTAIGIMSANPTVGLMRVIGDRGPAGQLSRVVLPLVVLIPISVGMLRLQGQRLGYYDTDTGVALQVFANVVMTFALLMFTIILLYRADLERRCREHAVRRSEEEYRLAERVGSVGHWRLDVRTNRFACSEELLAICCLPKGVPPSWSDILELHVDEDEVLQRECMESALRDGASWDASRRIVRPDGELHTIRSHGEVETDEHGEIVSLFGVFVEITELEDSRRQAEAATLAKAEFVANMSHEIRTPLNSIIGFTDLILDDDGLSANHRRQLNLVKNSGDALLTVVNDILDFSKLEAGKAELVMRPFDLGYLLHATASIVRQSAEAKGLKLTVNLDNTLSRCFVGDDSRMRQIILNLLSNAVKFTSEGEVSITVQSAIDNEGKPTILFEVSDTGVGVAPNAECRLFQQFSQSDPSISRHFGGTGLGLAICKNLVTMMGGTIGYRRNVDSGSVFYFSVSLQLTDQASAIEVKPQRLATASPLSILLVEDVAVNQVLAIAMLNRGGHLVEVASNGREAIAAVQQLDFDLVLMDIQMPVMDGITATKLIRLLPGKSRATPIIALTANVLPDQLETFRQAGMNDHVAKPINFSALNNAIARHAPRITRHEAEASPTAGDFDMVVYRQIVTMIPPDRLIVHLHNLRKGLIELRKMEGSAEALQDAAHAMVSEAGMFGFVKLSALCRDLENSLASSQPVDLLIANIRSATTRALTKINNLETYCHSLNGYPINPKSSISKFEKSSMTGPA